jgi:hypothetical protein
MLELVSSGLGRSPEGEDRRNFGLCRARKNFEMLRTARCGPPRGRDVNPWYVRLGGVTVPAHLENLPKAGSWRPRNAQR